MMVKEIYNKKCDTMIKYVKSNLEKSDKSYFQTQFWSSLEDLETVLGSKLDRGTFRGNDVYIFDGYAVLNDKREVVLEIYTPAPVDGVCKWHLRTSFYNDGLIIRNEIKSRVDDIVNVREIKK